MIDEQDEIARRAASLLQKDSNIDINEAVLQAKLHLGLPRDTPPPSTTLVRRHAQALAMARLGQEGYAQQRYERLVTIIDFIRQLEHEFPRARLALVGRASEGHFDADPHVRIRFVADTPIHLIADVLVRAHLPDPEIKTFASRVGVLEQLHSAFDFAPLTITRCPPLQLTHAHLDLQTGKPLAQRTLLQLEQLLTR
ncbi:MAG: hypothetical protein EXS12_07445 [Phycisphaerales bacterium]|nr:hypothetical protein [Phycisphaerales bacterium]